MQKKNIFFTYIQIRHLEGVLRWVSFFLSLGCVGGMKKIKRCPLIVCLSSSLSSIHGLQGHRVSPSLVMPFMEWLLSTEQ